MLLGSIWESITSLCMEYNLDTHARNQEFLRAGEFSWN